MKKVGLLLVAVLILSVGFYWQRPTLRSQNETIVVLTTPEPPKASPEEMATDQAFVKERYAEMIKSRVPITDVKPVDMTYTKGMSITVGDKRVQLPADVYVSDVTDSILCIDGIPCPQAPIYTLQYLGTEDKINVSVPTGEIYVIEQAKADEAKNRFAWLYAVMEAK